MAQLKDLVVMGATRLIGDVFANKIQVTAVHAPTSSNGATYGPGSNNQVLKSNGTTVYWGEDVNTQTVTGVKGNSESTYRTGQVNITAANIGLGNVENTKLSTWAGSANITTIGTLSSGTVPWARLSGVPAGASKEGTVTSVQVQANSPLQSSTSSAQSQSLSTIISFVNQSPNTVLAGPNSGSAAGAPSFRALVAADIPSITKSKISDFPTSMTPTAHTHGNITNDSKITTTATIATGDKIVIVDTDTTAGSKLTGSSITFDSTCGGYALTKAGTWAAFNNYSLPTASSTTKGGIKVDGGGLAMDEEKIKHSNAVTAQTTQALYPIKIDAQGHISAYGSAVTSMTPTSHTHGNITNDGKIGSTADYAVYTTTGGSLTAATFAVTDPTSSGSATSFIATVSQDSKGKISATKAALPVGSSSVTGILKIGTAAANAAAGNHTHSTYVLNTGDTMTGNLIISSSANPTLILKNTDMDISASSLSAAEYSTLRFSDTNGESVAYIQTSQLTSGTSRIVIGAKHMTGTSTSATNTLTISTDKDGNAGVSVSDDAAWRSAISAVKNSGDTISGRYNMERSNAGDYFVVWRPSGTTDLAKSCGFVRLQTLGAANTEGFAQLRLGNTTSSTVADNYSGYITLCNSAGGSCNISGKNLTLGSTAQNAIETTYLKGTQIWGAVWNDYAEFRETKEYIEPGRCIVECGNDILKLSTERLQRGCEIISDTYGFAIGQTEKAKTPTAASGRVLAYLYEDREIARSHIGWPVCSGPSGTVSIMTEEEEIKYPSRIIGTISSVPDYDIWQAGDNGDNPVKVNGRIWIRIR